MVLFSYVNNTMIFKMILTLLSFFNPGHFVSTLFKSFAHMLHWIIKSVLFYCPAVLCDALFW